MPELDLLVVGGAGVDTIVRVDGLPPPDADTLLVPPIRDFAGHTGNGVALAAHALGLGVRLVDFVGDDLPGDFLRRRYARDGLDVDLAHSPAGTRRSVNLVDPTGRRLSFYDGRFVAGQRLPDAHWRPHLAQARHVHLSIVDWARHLFADADAAGVPTSTDLHDWDGANPYHLDFALKAGLVFLSAARLGAGVGGVMARILREGRAEAVVATDGARGCHILDRGADGLRHVPAAVPQGPVVDSNGAGDAFAAAFLAGRFAGLPLADCARLGTVAGAHACTVEGTHEGFLDRATLLRRAGITGPGTMGR
ncbi:MAG TPA: carbohydrate kinase family protein [Azospirillaceae bacterium]|nr:carbohydrate kinase family protein [Azospirillaceae bacterium]